MTVVDLEDAAGELYALAPADFTSHRAELAAQARKQGAADVAKQIAELRKPTVAAWLINQLVRGEQDAGDDVEELESLGTSLRAAQARLDGTQMRELTRRRQQIVAALVRRAADLAGTTGQKLSAAVQRELEETFGAAVADEQASLAVLSGRLTRALIYAGLGEVDVTGSTATPLSQVHPARERSARREKSRSASPSGSPAPEGATGAAAAGAAAGTGAAGATEAAARARAADAVETAGAALAEAERELAVSTEQQDAAGTEAARLSAELEELQDKIVRTRHELDFVERRVAGAQREHQRRERQLNEARKAARTAADRLAELDGTDASRG